ncbi:MAG: DUF2283 domain-containing protein [Nanoarchaeota archaeon]|nr:DUF2283 domain-containing protein [Nanoarchaeota archaeon]
MKLTYDKEADAAYVYLVRHIRRGEAKKNIKVIGNMVLDFNDNGKLLGIEILNARKILKRETLAGAF